MEMNDHLQNIDVYTSLINDITATLVHVPFLFPGSLPAVFLTDPLLFHFFPEAAFQGQVYTPMNTSRTQDGSCHPLFSRSPHPHLYSFLLLPMPVSQDKNEIMAYHRKQKTDLPSPSVSDKNKSPLMALHQLTYAPFGYSGCCS